MGFWKNLFRLGSNSAADCYRRGLARMEQGACNEAIAEFTEAIRLDRQDLASYHDRAVTYTQTGEYDQAIADLTAAARLNPTCPPIYFNRGFAHTRKGDQLRAIEDYRQAITLDPYYAAPVAALSQALVALGEYREALASLDTVYSLVTSGHFTGPPPASPFSSSAEILLFQAQLCMKMADYGAAIDLCSLLYGNWQAHVVRGLAYAKKHDLQNALADYKEASKHKPPDWYDNKLCCLKGVIAQDPGNQELRTLELIAFGTWVLEYNSIFFGNTMEATEILFAQSATSAEKKARTNIIARILRTPGEFIPVVLYRLALALFADGKKEEAVFWLNVGRLRTWYDACRCADVIARNTSLRDMEVQVPEGLRVTEQQDRQLHARVIQEVLDWDDKTPYLYDHRWIYLHSSGAYIAQMGPKQAQAAGLREVRDPDAEPGALSLPEKRWPELRQTARQDFRRGLQQLEFRTQANQFVISDNDNEIAGATECSPQLQRDVFDLICTMENVVSGQPWHVAKVEIIESAQNPTFFGVGMLHGSWKERWHIARGDEVVAYDINFTADEAGGTHIGIQKSPNSTDT